MHVSVKTVRSITTADHDALFVFVWQNEKEEPVYPKEIHLIHELSRGALIPRMEKQRFNGEKGSRVHYHATTEKMSRDVVILGLGDITKLSVYDLQEVVASATKFVHFLGVSSVGVFIPDECMLAMRAVRHAVFAVTTGMALSQYEYVKHKKPDEKKKPPLEELTLYVAKEHNAEGSAAAEYAQTVVRGIQCAQDLVNEPPSDTTPEFLAETARSIASKNSGITCRIAGPAEMQKEGMGAILGVSRGSAKEPRFIELVYKGSAKETIVLIGKGITFDTGGLSLKPSEAMESMKTDMAGAAVVLGVFSVLASLKPAVSVVGLVAATENMPGPDAVKPGDVLRAANGTTIEVLNTDAEGRLVLADALAYAGKHHAPDVVIDIATLTGACLVALGPIYAGLFSTSDALARLLGDAGADHGERLWRLPLVDEYQQYLKSTIADIRNISTIRWGGAITAALFLREFVPNGSSWAHLDIAGPAFSEKGSDLHPQGGTGFAVATLLGYLLGEEH